MGRPSTLPTLNKESEVEHEEIKERQSMARIPCENFLAIILNPKRECLQNKLVRYMIFTYLQISPSTPSIFPFQASKTMKGEGTIG